MNSNKTKSLLYVTFKVVKGDLDVPGRHAVVMDETIDNITAKCLKIYYILRLTSTLTEWDECSFPHHQESTCIDLSILKHN